MPNPFFCLSCGKPIDKYKYVNAKFCDFTCRKRYQRTRDKIKEQYVPKYIKEVKQDG